MVLIVANKHFNNSLFKSLQIVIICNKNCYARTRKKNVADILFESFMNIFQSVSETINNFFANAMHKKFYLSPI